MRRDRLMKYLCIRLIRFYQKFLSPRKRTPTCRLSPTCSAFAIEAFQKRGFFAGMVLTFFRILRCNPFCPGGYDPVPERGITVRSYYASRAGGRVEDDSDDMIDGEDEETRSDTVNREFDPAAGVRQRTVERWLPKTETRQSVRASDLYPRTRLRGRIPKN